MHMVKKTVISIILLPLLILVFSPKKELLFLLEKRLAAQGIVLADGHVETHPFGLTIDHPSLYVKGIKVATLRHLSLWSVLFYTKGSIEGIAFDPSLKSYLPARIAHVTVVHSVIDPLHAQLHVEDPTVQGKGSIYLKKRTLSLRFTKLPKGISTTRYLKHTKGGWVYAQQF